MRIFKTNKLLVITILSIFFLIFFQSLFLSINVEYRPYNGDFQTFNPLRRIFVGQFPGRDFNPYLGLGVTYINAFTTYLLGGNFAASKFSTYFLSVSLHFIALIILFFLIGVNLKKAIIAAAFPLITIYLDREKNIPIWKLIEPSNSNLSLRSSLPFITIILMLLLFKLRDKKPKLFYSLCGCLISFQVFWSNDYGIPSFLTLFAIIIFDLIKQKQHNKFFYFTWLLAFIFISFSIEAYILTAGKPTNWIRDNFSGVAADQFWYFLWFNEINKIFTIADIFSNPFLYCYLIAIILLTFYVIFINYNIKYVLLLYLSTTVYGAGILSSLGGTISARYYFTSILVALFIFPVIIYYIFSFILKLFKIRINVNNFFKQKTIQSSLLIFLIIYYPTISLIDIIISENFIFNPANNPDFFFVQELGGWLPQHWQKSINIARNIKQELKNTPPTQRILSTYSSGMDTVAGAFNPTGIDYIIHALGEDSRNKYLQKFHEQKPKYITTLREDKTIWEIWIRRTNWWFYRDFFTNYKPIEATFYNIIWQRLDKPKNLNQPNIICNVKQENDHKFSLIINPENQENQGKIYYIELDLDYSLEVKNSGVPLMGKRGLVNVIDNHSNLNRWIGQNYNRKYGLPPGYQHWYIPIEHRMGTSSSIDIRSYPIDRSKLMINSCKAKLFAPIDNFTITRQLKAANINNSDWQKGINISNKNQTGFIIEDEQILAEVYPGMDIEFAKSGERQIIDITDNKIWVNGLPLDILGDGYPNLIQVKLK